VDQLLHGSRLGVAFVAVVVAAGVAYAPHAPRPSRHLPLAAPPVLVAAALPQPPVPPAVADPGPVVPDDAGTVTNPPPAAAPSSCHARGPLPDPVCTPGALNPDVTQATIGQTICVRGYTKTIRPPQSVTGPQKLASLAAYGDGAPTGYEYDHLVSLELGGAPDDTRNLWPEPHAGVDGVGVDGSQLKDTVENTAKASICNGTLPLVDAQTGIATDWAALGRRLGVPGL